MEKAFDQLSQEAFDDINSLYIGTQIIYKDETLSTNTDVKLLGESGAESGSIVIASRQLKGKGRLGRSWDSAADKDIFMSLLLRTKDSHIIPLLTLFTGLCAANAVQAVSGLETLIKWPNDVVINGRKVCGILAESNILNGKTEFTAIGIGINVNRESFPIDIKAKATSMLIEANKKFDRRLVIKRLINEMDKAYPQLMKQGALSFLTEYKEKCVNLGKEVCVTENNVNYMAKAVDITDNGHLLIEDNKGSRREILSGEVSVRGIYGYV